MLFPGAWIGVGKILVNCLSFLIILLSVKRAITLDEEVAIAVVDGEARAVRMPWATRFRGRVYLRTARVASRDKNRRLGFVIGSAVLASVSPIVPKGELWLARTRGRYIWSFESPERLKYSVELPGCRRRFSYFDGDSLDEPSAIVAGLISDLSGAVPVGAVVEMAAREGLAERQVAHALRRLFFRRRIAFGEGTIRIL